MLPDRVPLGRRDPAARSWAWRFGCAVPAGAQLRRLIDTAERPNITLQVLPFTTAAHVQPISPFTILEFPDPADPTGMTSHAVDLSRPVWHKSTYSGGNGGQCVEVATNLPGVIAVRDSKNPNGPKLAVSPEQWHVFLVGLKLGTAD